MPRFPRSIAVAVPAIAGAVIVAGCATGPDPLGPRRQTPIPEGSTLVLERRLELPPGRARVFLQGGRVAGAGTSATIDRFQPSCSFGLEQVDDEPLIDTIEPDRFRTGPTRDRDRAGASTSVGVVLAGGSSVSFGIGIRFGFGLGGGTEPGHTSYTLALPLSSPRQPQVDDFTCSVDRPRTWGGTLGLEAVRQAAGDLVRVELAADPDDDTEDD